MIINLNKEGKINAIIILEIIGRPSEYLIETLNNMVQALGEEKGVEVVNKSVNEPVVMKENKDFFTSFAEIELYINGLDVLAEILFKYMPAHIEILSPETLQITNNELNEIFNSLMRKLHGYDEIARVLQTEKILLQRELKKLMEEKKDSKEIIEKEDNSEKKKDKKKD